MNQILSKFLKILAAGGLALLTGIATAGDRPYSEGPVLEVTSIRTVDGMFDDYVAWLAGPWQDFMEAQKKAGLILDYSVHSASPRTPADPDLYLVTAYPNMGSLDGLEEKVMPIMEKTLGNQQKATADTVARGKMRTVLGSELIRELKLK